MSEFEKDSLSLEETNRLRVSLGLKPLSDDSGATGTNNDSQQQNENASAKPNAEQVAEENYRHRRQEEAKRKEDEDVRQRIARAQNRRDLKRQLRGPTLGAADESAEAGPSDYKSTAKWLKQAKKNAALLAAQRSKDLEEQDAAPEASYGESDLAGLRVAHDIDDFNLQEGDESRILTLRDSKILDGDDDELMDSTLEQKELDRRNQERKKGPKQYTGLDEDEDEIGSGKRRGVLSKYDADIPGGGVPRDSDAGFTLGGSTETTGERHERKRLDLAEEARRNNRTLLSLDYSKNQESSDYLAPGDIGFKKSKVKKKKRPAATRIKFDEDDDGASAAAQSNGHTNDVEMKPVVHAPRQADLEDNLADDDELSASLARARRAKARKAISKMTPEQIARNLAAQREAEQAAEGNAATNQPGDHVPADEEEQPEDTQGGMTFDATSEFIRSIGNQPDLADARRPRRQENSAPVIKAEPMDEADLPPTLDGDHLLQSSQVKAEDEDDGYEEGAMGSDTPIAPESRPPAASGSPDPGMGTSAEPVVGHGLGSTLSMLRSQGLLQATSDEQKKREADQRKYDLWKAKRMAEEALREQERQMSKLQGSAKDQATREYENKMRELDEARRAEERFKDYKPDVDIKYHDQYGRVLNNHEAWKLLSHTFHGKMPGKAKQEKYKRKVDEERKAERMAAGEAQDMSKAFRERQAREGQAHMVLSVGARGNAPQDFADSIGPNLVQSHHAKSSAVNGGGGSANGQGKGKGKVDRGSAAAPSPTIQGSLSPQVGLRSVQRFSPGNQTVASHSLAAPSNDGATSVGSTATTAQGPRMRPAFQPVSSTPSAAPPSFAGDAGGMGGSGGSGFKLSFGQKRKADEQGGR